MKLKNVKVGTRVILKKDCDRLKAQMTGTILEDCNPSPYVEWDDFDKGYNSVNSTNPYSVWCVQIKYLKRIKD